MNKPRAKDTTDYRIAIRPDDDGMTDDVVIRDVHMFRAEMLSKTDLWLSCYLDPDAEQRVTFIVHSTRQGLRIWLTETPHDMVCESDSDIETCHKWTPAARPYGSTGTGTPVEEIGAPQPVDGPLTGVDPARTTDPAKKFYQ